MRADRATAMVLEEPRRLRRRQFPVPETGPDDGVLAVEACGLCGTDHEQYTGDLRLPYAFIPGHEVVGTVERAGEKALARWGVSAGDRVAVEVFMSCRRCAACRSGDYRRCACHGPADMYGFIDVESPPHLWGGYATYLYLAPDALVLPVPRSLDPRLATLFNPLGAGVRWATEVAGTAHGDIVVVLGPGVRGLSCLVAAKSAGASFALVTGLGSRDRGRLALARRFGADAVVDVARADPVEELQRGAGALADVVIDVTAKSPEAPAQALRLVRPGGTVVLAGTRGFSKASGFDPDLIVLKEVQVRGALGVDTDSYRRALNMLASGDHPFEEVARRTAGFDSIEALLRSMAGDEGDAPPLHAVFSPG